MRIALISDIHANHPALDAVLSHIQSDAFDAVYQLGDLVGYAPWPNEVVARIRADGIVGVAGNYDSTVATNYKHCGCRYEDPHQEELSHLSYEWTKANISSSTKAWLGTLPFRIDVRPLGGHISGPTLTLLHGNQTLNTVYVTEDRTDAFLSKMGEGAGARAGDIVAFGHTHKAWHRIVDGIQFVNCGSVGRPKDGDPRAGFVALEVGSAGVEVEIVRVEYDVERAAQGVLESSLPHEFADQLRAGGVPLVAASDASNLDG
jgi:predicted phosphodiesterase